MGNKVLTDQLKISVIIPCYNSEKFIAQTLNSVFSQSHKNIEVIVVDDSSTDNTVAILNEFKKRNDNLKVITRSEHENAGACRNVGIIHATGDYIHFLDADDWLDLKAYERALKRIGSKDVDVCVFQYVLHDNQTSVETDALNMMIKQSQTVTLKQYPQFLIYSPVVPWNKLVKRSVIQENQLKFDEIQCANDRSFYFKLMKAAKKVLVIPDKLIYYRVNNAGSLIGSGRTKNFECIFDAFESTVSAYEDADPKIKEILTDACVKDMFYFFRKLPEENKSSVGESITSFFLNHPEISSKDPKLSHLIEDVKKGDHSQIDRFESWVSHSRFDIFKNGFWSGLKLFFLKIKCRLSRGED